MVEIKISDENQNQRLDKYLLKYLNTAPKSFIYKILRKKYIKLNNTKATGSELLSAGDIIALYLSDETIANFKEDKQFLSTKKDFKIIFEDENIILCYKPIGLVSQPDINNKDNSLNDQLLSYMYENGELSKSSDFTPSICNRLDRNTSGIVCFGKNFKSLQALNSAFKSLEIDKYYITAVYGELKTKGTIKLYHKKEDNKAILSENYKEGSKEIITEYTPIKTKDNKTLVEVKLITGKTHQIRAGFEHIGFPIIGDTKYTNAKFNTFNLKNQFLHCYKVGFNSQNETLKYLYNKEFICNFMDKSFKNVLDFFEFKL